MNDWPVVFYLPYKRDWDAANAMWLNLNDQLNSFLDNEVNAAKYKNYTSGRYADGQTATIVFSNPRTAVLFKLSVSLQQSCPK